MRGCELDRVKSSEVWRDCERESEWSESQGRVENKEGIGKIAI